MKTRWALLGEYHPTESERSFRVEGVDAEVKEKLRKEALFNKWLAKSGKASGGDGG